MLLKVKLTFFLKSLISLTEGEIYRTKKAAPFDVERLFSMVAQRMELSNHFHNDLDTVEEYLQAAK